MKPSTILLHLFTLLTATPTTAEIMINLRKVKTRSTATSPTLASPTTNIDLQKVEVQQPTSTTPTFPFSTATTATPALGAIIVKTGTELDILIRRLRLKEPMLLSNEKDIEQFKATIVDGLGQGGGEDGEGETGLSMLMRWIPEMIRLEAFVF